MIQIEVGNRVQVSFDGWEVDVAVVRAIERVKGVIFALTMLSVGPGPGLYVLNYDTQSGNWMYYDSSNGEEGKLPNQSLFDLDVISSVVGKEIPHITTPRGAADPD